MLEGRKDLADYLWTIVGIHLASMMGDKEAMCRAQKRLERWWGRHSAARRYGEFTEYLKICQIDVMCFLFADLLHGTS